ncbi:MAG: hypothetical protein WCJ29_01245 [bacterium]
MSGEKKLSDVPVIINKVPKNGSKTAHEALERVLDTFACSIDRHGVHWIAKPEHAARKNEHGTISTLYIKLHALHRGHAVRYVFDESGKAELCTRSGPQIQFSWLEALEHARKIICDELRSTKIEEGQEPNTEDRLLELRKFEDMQFI